MEELILLILNIILYIYAFSYYSKCNRGNYLLRFFIIEYLCVSICALYIWYSGIYNNSSRLFIRNDMSFFPYIIVYVLMLLLIRPIRNFDIRVGTNIEVNFSLLKIVNYIAILIAIYLAYSLLPYMSTVSSMEAVDIYTNQRIGIGLLPHKIGVLITIFNIFYPVMLISVFYYLSLPKEIPIRRILILLICIIIPTVLAALCNASRGSLFFRFFDLILMLLIFKQFLSPQIKKILYLFLGILVTLLALIAIVISISRSGEENAINEIFRYFGESPLNFNLVFWGNIEEPIGGERMFPYLFLDSHVFSDTLSELSYYNRISGTPLALFKMLYGDFYVEFDWYGMLAAIIIISLIGRWIFKQKRFSFLTIYLIFIYCQICFGSIFGFVKSGETNFKVTICQLILIYIISYKNEVYNRHTCIQK